MFRVLGRLPVCRVSKGARVSSEKLVHFLNLVEDAVLAEASFDVLQAAKQTGDEEGADGTEGMQPGCDLPESEEGQYGSEYKTELVLALHQAEAYREHAGNTSQVSQCRRHTEEEPDTE